MRKFLVLTAAATAMLAASPEIASAAPKHCPPGHAKKGWCGGKPRHDRHGEREYVVIRDHDRYGLRPPRDGYYYGVRDNEVYLISRATQDIIEGLGAVSYLLNR